jgi:hypothetical protein
MAARAAYVLGRILTIVKALLWLCLRARSQFDRESGYLMLEVRE